MRFGDEAPDGGKGLAGCAGLEDSEEEEEDESRSAEPGLGEGLKRLDMPEIMTPGWRPRRGASKETVPRMR